jgi:hypothetical protein
VIFYCAGVVTHDRRSGSRTRIFILGIPLDKKTVLAASQSFLFSFTSILNYLQSGSTCVKAFFPLSLRKRRLCFARKKVFFSESTRWLNFTEFSD